MEMKILTAGEERELSNAELENYYSNLRTYLQEQDYHSSRVKGFERIIAFVSKKIRHFSVIFEGNVTEARNIENAVFCFNHSNSHDSLIMSELMHFLCKNTILFAAKDETGLATQKLFSFYGAELIDRTDPQSCIAGETNAVNALLKGYNVVIFPEGTWNLHPYKPMLPLHIGACRMSAKSGGKPIIPVIMEYIESNKIAGKESEIIEKCVVRIGNPIFDCNSGNMVEKTQELENQMAEMRKEIRKREGRLKKDLSDVDVYLNHLKLKTSTMKLHYNFQYELQFVRKSNDGKKENAFCIDEQSGQFVPMK